MTSTTMQVPRAQTISDVLSRLSRVYGPDTSEQVADWFVQDWAAAQGAPDRGQGAYAAAQLLIRAGHARAQGMPAMAGQLDVLAECCARAWADEMTAAVAALDVEDHA